MRVAGEWCVVDWWWRVCVSQILVLPFSVDKSARACGCVSASAFFKEERRGQQAPEPETFILWSSARRCPSLAGMRQLRQAAPPFVDGEGFPQGTEVKPVVGRDKESGELVCSKIVCSRKQSELRLSPRIQSFLSSNAANRSHGDGRRFTGFRIQQFSPDGACEGPHRRSGRPKSLVGPHLQTCVYLEGGTPVHYTRRPVDPHGPSLGVVRRHDRSVREAFRVPKDSLPKEPAEQPVRNPNTISVNIWEEFLFGKSVLSNKRGTNGRRGPVREVEEEGLVNFVHRILGPFLPKFIVDLLTYIVYFLVFFFSCVGYNMWCELGCYILLAQHLKIHEKAYEEKLDVAFTGSIFQGPLYALTRNWCEHCNHRERAQVMMRLMSKMKTDILPPPDASDAADSPPKDTTQGPS